MIKNISKVFIALLLAFSLYENAVPVYALPTSVSLPLTRREQEKSYWCWAASAQMAGEYYGKNISQSTIVYQIRGTFNNVGARGSDTLQAINFALPQGKKAVETNVESKTFLQTKLSNSHVVPIVMQWNNGSGHVVVLSGYDSQGKLTITDPGKGCIQERSYPYNQLITNVTILSGTGKYVRTYVIN